MSTASSRRWPAFVASGLILLIVATLFLWPAARLQMLTTRVAEIAGDDPYCSFDGRWHNRMPVARIVPTDWASISLWSDVRDRFLVSDPANPFHFGIVVMRAGEDGALGPEVWGWSWRKLDFWPVEGNLFDLAYFGDLLAECRANSVEI